MNTDAAQVLLWLTKTEVARKPSTVAKYTDIPRERVDGALTLLVAIGKVKRNSDGTVEAVRASDG